MPKSSSFLITKPEIKFWLAIITIIVGGAVAFTRLQSQVNAMTSREQANKGQFVIVVESVKEIKETLVKMETNQKHIMRELGIEVN